MNTNLNKQFKNESNAKQQMNTTSINITNET